MRLPFAAALAAPILALASGPGLAQDYNGAPTYGEFRLSPGFTPDPGMLSVLAGGSVDASTRFTSCRGYIAVAPDVRLYWDAAGKSSLNLIISALSNADTTIVVNGPDGSWYCDDDSGEDSNPTVTLTPMAGRYEIWIGTYSQGENKKAVLSISELSSF